MGVSISIHYGRRPGFGTILARAPAPAPTPAPACRQLRRNGIEFRVDAGGASTDRGFIQPFFRIQTLQPLRQSVALFGRPSPAGNPLLQIGVALPHPRRLGGTQGCAQRRLVDDHNLGRRRRLGPPLRSGTARALTPRPRAATPGPIRLGPELRRFARERGPVECHVRVGVLESLDHLFVERAPADAEVRGRPEQVQHPGT